MLPALGIAIIGGVAVFGAKYTNAQTMPTGPNSSLAQKLSQRFNLNQTDVQKFFDEEHQARESQMQQNLETKLSQAVTSGKITEAQKQAILAKMAELKSNKPDMANFKSLTQEQRKAQMDQKKVELEAWASQNGLSMQTLQDLMVLKFRGPGHMMAH